MQVQGKRIAVEGALTLDSAAAVLADGGAALTSVWAGADAAIMDMAAVKAVDSAALAVVFAWVRQAHAAGKQVGLENPPPELLSLAAVYGVGDMLPTAASA